MDFRLGSSRSVYLSLSLSMERIIILAMLFGHRRSRNLYLHTLSFTSARYCCPCILSRPPQHLMPSPSSSTLSPPQVPDDAVYTANYCEENVYLLAKHFLQLQKADSLRNVQWDIHVVFISNSTKSVCVEITYLCSDPGHSCPSSLI